MKNVGYHQTLPLIRMGQALLLGVSLFSLLSLGLIGVAASSDKAGVPALPQEFKAASSGKKATLMEFSAPWCTSCRKIHPMVESLKKEFPQKLGYIAINIDKEASQKYMDQYQLSSVPTYVLYNAQGKALEKIERDISPQELKSIVLKALN